VQGLNPANYISPPPLRYRIVRKPDPIILLEGLRHITVLRVPDRGSVNTSPLGEGFRKKYSFSAREKARMRKYKKLERLSGF